LMYAPGTKRKYDQTYDHRDRGFHSSNATRWITHGCRAKWRLIE
jgi:hypothetical protein